MDESIDTSTITGSFAQFLVDQGIATFGQDLYTSKVPNSLNTTTKLYWLVTSGGSPLIKLRTGEIVKLYTIRIYYRSDSAKDVEKKLFQLEELLNCSRCVELTNFEVVEVDVTQFPSDEDIDSEEREVGMLQVNIKTYKKEC